jgi:hypothetical protein
MAELGAEGTRAVLEVRSHDVPFLIEQGQTVCRLVYEPMVSVPATLYGTGGIKLSITRAAIGQTFYSGLTNWRLAIYWLIS